MTGWQVTFPIVFVLPTAGVAGCLAIGAGFHIACAVVMGLNRFVWSLCGCCPAVWALAVGW